MKTELDQIAAEYAKLSTQADSLHDRLIRFTNERECSIEELQHLAKAEERLRWSSFALKQAMPELVALVCTESVP